MQPEIITIRQGGDLYPEILSQIPDPPEQLFVMGDPQVLHKTMVAIIGTRKPTDYGIRAATHFARSLARNMVVVSGLAYGIDTIVLSEALAAEAHPVVAVIGSGLDRESFYPAVNWGLALKIIEKGGVVISEYPPGTPPLKHHFPARNRIIAGLSRGTLVIEAGEGSGALITANLALDYNREVFSLAGNIFVPQAQGVNQLIQEGALMVTSLNDVLTALRIEPQPVAEIVSGPSSSLESKITELLNVEAMSVDEIARIAQLDSAKVSSTLTLMEIKGMVKSTGAGKFARLN